MRRVVAAQGGIQLVSALTALEGRAGEADPAAPDEAYLVIHGLHAPAERVSAFAAALRRMAEALRPWKRIVELGPDQAGRLAETIRTAGVGAAAARVRELVGLPAADEVYVIRSTGFGNALLLHAYPTARKIAFGDGIGLYFPDGFLAPSPPEGWASRLRRLRGAVGEFRDRLRGRALGPVRLDVGYFALPDALGARPPMPTVRVERASLLATLAALRDGLGARPGRGLRARIGERPVTFLLTSNLSEAGRMRREDELHAYRELLAEGGDRREAVAVIKPHPRDGAAKIEALRRGLEPMFADVLVLDEGDVAFLPFELVLMDGFLGPDRALRPDVSIVTVSSACLSLALLFGAGSRLGFGEAIVRRRFRPEHVESRLREEAALGASLERIVAAADPAG